MAGWNRGHLESKLNPNKLFQIYKQFCKLNVKTSKNSLEKEKWNGKVGKQKAITKTRVKTCEAYKQKTTEISETIFIAINVAENCHLVLPIKPTAKLIYA